MNFEIRLDSLKNTATNMYIFNLMKQMFNEWTEYSSDKRLYSVVTDVEYDKSVMNCCASL